jgi:N-acetylglutamate synthase-like GNAT family acetyltransferase
MKFIPLQDNPEYYNIIAPYYYDEWSEIYIKNNIYNTDDIIDYLKNKKKSKTFILINNNKQFIGSIALAKYNDQLFFEDGYVIPALRKNSIASFMLNYSIELATKMNYSVVYVYSKQKYLQAYLNRGFKIIKKTNELYLLKYNIVDNNVKYTYLLYAIIIILLAIVLIYFI